jgi:uncharacterized protein YbbC (DUF1343 family)
MQACAQAKPKKEDTSELNIANPQVLVASQINKKEIITGAERLEKYIPLLKGKRVGLVVNQTSVVGNQHLVDVLRAQSVQIITIFAPEHGFRGTADAGEHIKSGVDKTTGLPVVSLYGAKKVPSATDLEQIDVLVFDIQDVGVRFYTYLSTLYYVLEAANKYKKELIVLDRPNPNGHYIDGPVLEEHLTSFVGVVKVPIVHGCTMGEMAQMIHGENWRDSKNSLKLTVITCENYTHDTPYTIPIPPSPNLRTQRAIYLYPTLCLLEGTDWSVGRGTDTPFEVIGGPTYGDQSFSFMPVSMPGAQSPPHIGGKVYGRDFRGLELDSLRKDAKIDWQIILDAYQKDQRKERFFLRTDFFDKLVGDQTIKGMIKNGASAQQIHEHYQPNLEKYKLMRKKYLIYD